MMVNKEFEDYLLMRVHENDDSRTKDAMAYSLMNGGKRVRPTLLFSVLEGYGMDARIGYPCACAIEMIHTYSLVHDDLPAMDNDDLRRGKPSCHKAYDEATAILAGDGLLTKAFEVALDSECSAEQKVALVKALSWYAGIDGMIYGQTLDLQSENDPNPTLALLQEIDHYKTSKLLTLPLVCGCILANKFDDVEHFRKIGLVLGLEFQMQDDILDVTSTAEVLGKPIHSDEKNNKVTYVSLVGAPAAASRVKELSDHAVELLDDLDRKNGFLDLLVESLVSRRK